MRVFGFGLNPEVAYPSSHRRIRGAEEMLASTTATPIDKDKAVVHYTALARQAREEAVAEWIPEGELLDDFPHSLDPQIEHEWHVGHDLKDGVITIEKAYEQIFVSTMGSTAISPTVRASVNVTEL